MCLIYLTVMSPEATTGNRSTSTRFGLIQARFRKLQCNLLHNSNAICKEFLLPSCNVWCMLIHANNTTKFPLYRGVFLLQALTCLDPTTPVQHLNKVKASTFRIFRQICMKCLSLNFYESSFFLPCVLSRTSQIINYSLLLHKFRRARSNISENR